MATTEPSSIPEEEFPLDNEEADEQELSLADLDDVAGGRKQEEADK